MGKRGPAPAPTALKLVKGTRKDRVNTTEPVPAEASTVKPPKWLKGDGLAIWRQYAPDLERQGVLKPWDCEEFGMWCDCCAKRRVITAQIDREGMTIEEPVVVNGEVVGHRIKRNPATVVEKALTDSILRYGARFGLTPSDRSQLKVGDAENRNPKGRLLTS